MGLFLDRDLSSQKQTVASNTYYVNGNTGCYQPKFGEMLLQNLPSLFMYGLSQFAEDDSTDDNNGEVGKNTQKKIDKLNKKLQDEIYSKVGGNAAGLTSEIQKGTEAVSAAQSKVDAINNGTDDISKQITAAKQADPNADVSALEQQKLLALQTAEQELKNAQLYKANMETLKAQEENILLEIERLKNSDASPEITYNVQEETSQLHTFNEKLKNFTSIKSDLNAKPEDIKDAAKELMTAYYGGNGDKTASPIIDNKTAQSAWAMIEPQIKEALAA